MMDQPNPTSSRDSERVWNGEEYAWNGRLLQARKLPAWSPGRRLGRLLARSGISGAYGVVLSRPVWWAAKLARATSLALHKALWWGNKASVLSARPAEVVLSPDMVVRSEMRANELGSSSGRERPEKGQPVTSLLVAVYMDGWTLEFTAPEVEASYMEYVLQPWQMWMVLCRLMNVFSDSVSFSRAFDRLLNNPPLIEQGSVAVLMMALFLCCLSNVLLLVPSWRKNARRLGLVAQGMRFFMFPWCHVMAQDSVRLLTPQWYGDSVVRVSDLLTLCVYEQLVKWYMVREMRFYTIACFISCIMSIPLSPASKGVPKGIGCVVTYYLHFLACYYYEASQRSRFLEGLAATRDQEHERHPLLLREALRRVCQAAAQPQQQPTLDVSGMTEMLLECTQLFPEGRTTIGKVAPSALHLRLTDVVPDMIPSSFVGCLADCLKQEGLQLEESFISAGSLLLAVLVNEEEDEREQGQHGVEQLVRQLMEQDINGALFEHQYTIQWGQLLHRFRGHLKLGETAALAPEILDVRPRVLPAGMQQELQVTVAIKSVVPPSSLAIIIRSAGGSLVLRLPCEVQGSCAILRHTVTLDAGDSGSPCGIQILEVYDSEVFSAPTPLVVVSDSQLFREVNRLEAWLSVSPPSLRHMSSSRLLWSLRYALDFHAAFWALPQGLLQHLLTAGTVPAAGPGTWHGLSLPFHVLKLAARVQRSTPAVMGLAALLGLPALLQLLIRSSKPAFLPTFLAGPQLYDLDIPPPLPATAAAAAAASSAAGTPAAASPAAPSVAPSSAAPAREAAAAAGPAPPLRSNEVFIPAAKPSGGWAVGSSGVGTALPQALAALVHAAGREGHVATTLLHLFVTAGSGASVKVMQEEAAQSGLQLNWAVRAPVCLPSPDKAAGKAPMELSAMELAVVRLPTSRQVVQQAITGEAAAAGAWLAAVDSIAAKGLKAGGDPGSHWSDALSHIACKEAAARPPDSVSAAAAAGRGPAPAGAAGMTALLRFTDPQLEQEWFRTQGAKRLRSMDAGVALVCLLLLAGSCWAALAGVSPPSLGIVAGAALGLAGSLYKRDHPVLLPLRNAALQVLLCAGPLLKGLRPTPDVTSCSPLVPGMLACGTLPLLLVPLPFCYQIWLSFATLLLRGGLAAVGMLELARECWALDLHSAATAVAGVVILHLFEWRARSRWLQRREQVRAAAKKAD